MDAGVVFWLVIGGAALAGIIGHHFTETKKSKLIESLIEKGQPIPPQLFEGRKPYDWRGFMVGGVILVAAGIGLAIFFTALITWQVQGEGERFLPFISAFPITLGVALLLIARYLKNNG